jgi:hypothetical protein
MSVQKLKNKLFKIILGYVSLLLVLFTIFFILNSIPTKSSFEYKPELPPMFKKLAEYDSYSSYFVAINNNLSRIDVLFKNQALESKEELKVTIFDDQNNVIFDQKYDSGNFGDTNRVRMDFGVIPDSKNKKFKVLITPLKISDWKLYFGVKGDDIDLIQYFNNRFGFKDSTLISLKLILNPIFLLPLFFVTLFLW